MVVAAIVFDAIEQLPEILEYRILIDELAMVFAISEGKEFIFEFTEGSHYALPCFMVLVFSTCLMQVPSGKGLEEQDRG